jgi:hypothetical protein
MLKVRLHDAFGSFPKSQIHADVEAELGDMQGLVRRGLSAGATEPQKP